MADFPHTAPDTSWPPVPCSQQQQQHDDDGLPPPIRQPVPLPRKAQRRRKRHVPVGPAGVWFQNFQQSSDGRPTNKTNPSNNDGDDEEEEDQQDALQNLRRSVQRRAAHSNASLASFSSPAWIAMQCDCRWVTPVLASHLTIEERYEQLRPHVPPQFTMIPELVGTSKDSSVDRDPWFCEHVMVLVSNIHGSTTANGWTVALTDETGATLTAWIQPDSIRRQLQRPSSTGGDSSTKSWLRTGCVWWLQNTTLLLSPDSPETGTRTLSFLLLVGEDNVKQVWTPSDGESLSDERYLQWIEQRNQVQGDGHYNDLESTSDGTDRRCRSPETSVSPLLRSVQGLSRTSRQISPQMNQPTTSPALRQNPSSRTARDVPSLARTPVASTQTESSSSQVSNTQQTLTSAAPSDVLTIASSPRPRRHNESQFAAFRSTFSLQDEAAPANSPTAQIQTTDVPGDTASKRRRLLDFSVSESLSPTKGRILNRPSQSSQNETQKLPNERTQTPIRKALNSNVKSASSNTKMLSSMQKRRRKAHHSKLWTGALCLDFSDADDDDDDDALDVQLAPETTSQNEADGESPKSKRSLFRQDALEELANLLSSDDESEGGV